MGLIDKASFEARGARGGESSQYAFVMTTCCERVGVIDDSRGDFYFNHENLGSVVALDDVCDCPLCDAPVWSWTRLDDAEHIPAHWRWASDGQLHRGRRRIRSLTEHVSELLSLYRPLPEHESLRVLDISNSHVGGERNRVVPRSALLTVAQLEPRFDALLRAGYAWINLSVEGVFEGLLVLGVELPREPSGVPAGLTSVNYSGPPARPDGTSSWELELIVRD